MPGQMQKPEAEKKFNTKTHYFDKRGRLKARNLLRAHIVAGTTYYERPVNSGNLWYENDTPAGRVEFLTDDKGKKKKSIDFNAAHKVYVKPMEGEEKLSFENQNLKSENEAILAELKAMQLENERLKAAQEQDKQIPIPSKPVAPLVAAQGAGGTNGTAKASHATFTSPANPVPIQMPVEQLKQNEGIQ